MILKLSEIDYEKVLKFIRKDNARNYFIRLGLESNKPVFENIYAQVDGDGNMRAALFHRKSGNLQFYADGAFEVEGFTEILRSIQFRTLISPSSFCDRFEDKQIFDEVKEGAYIAELKDYKRQYEYGSYHDVKPLSLKDLDIVIDLYSKVFPSHSSLEVMREKFEGGRGRGVCIKKDGRIIAVAQSEFEETKSALIVGVATDPDYQGKGYASQCLEVLCKELLSEGKKLFLQYDNIDAGRIYGRLGFRPIDQVKHYKRALSLSK